MVFDNKTGDVTILEKKKVQKKIIRNMDDLERERDALYKEVGLKSQKALDDADLSTTEK